MIAYPHTTGSCFKESRGTNCTPPPRPSLWSETSLFGLKGCRQPACLLASSLPSCPSPLQSQDEPDTIQVRSNGPLLKTHHHAPSHTEQRAKLLRQAAPFSLRLISCGSPLTPTTATGAALIVSLQHSTFLS